jgi:hypothetical protein
MLLIRYAQEIIDGIAEMKIYNLPRVIVSGSRTSLSCLQIAIRVCQLVIVIAKNKVPRTAQLNFQMVLRLSPTSITE